MRVCVEVLPLDASDALEALEALAELGGVILSIVTAKQS